MITISIEETVRRHAERTGNPNINASFRPASRCVFLNKVNISDEGRDKVLLDGIQIDWRLVGVTNVTSRHWGEIVTTERRGTT